MVKPKGILHRRAFCLAIGLATLALPVRAQGDGTRAPLTVGFVNNYPPFSYVDQNDNTLHGFDVEINKALAQVWNQTFTHRVGSAAQLLKWLRTGDIDLIGNQLLATPTLRQEFKLTHGFVNLQLIVCQREDDDRDFLTLEDFQGYKLGVLSGTAVDEQGSVVLGSDVIRFDAATQALDALMRNQVDAVIDENLILDHLIFKQNLPLKTTTPFSGPIRSGWVFAGDNSGLRDRFTEGLKVLRASGRIRPISEKWFGYDVSQRRVGAVIQHDTDH